MVVLSPHAAVQDDLASNPENLQKLDNAVASKDLPAAYFSHPIVAAALEHGDHR